MFEDSDDCDRHVHSLFWACVNGKYAPYPARWTARQAPIDVGEMVATRVLELPADGLDVMRIRAIAGLAIRVEQAVVRNHQEAVKAWREGRLPTAQPPASPVFLVEGSGS